MARRVGIAVGLVGSIAALFAAFAFAAPGQRDKGFGRGGVVAATLGPHYRETGFSAVAESTDEGFLVERDERALRYSARGVRDRSFSGEPFSFSPPAATQSDGKRLVPGENGGIVRLLADGSPDPSFHGGESEALAGLSVEAIAVSDSGQIFVAGVNVYLVAPKGCYCQTAVAQLNPDGTIDKAFGTDGQVGLFTDLKVEGTGLAGLAPQDDGGVVVVASGFVLKLTAAGGVDTSYGKGGEVGPRRMRVADFQVLPGDVLELAGTLGEAGSDFFAARFGPDGRPDPGFANGAGLATIDFGGDDTAGAVVFEADGSILLGGATATSSQACWAIRSCPVTPALARFTAAGLPDSSFGDGGRVRIEALRGAGEGNGAAALLVRRRGDIIAVGSGGRGSASAFIAALGPRGNLEREFGTDGLVTDRRPERSQQIGDPVVEVGPGHRIYVAVWNDAGAGYSGPSVIRFRRNGRLDRGFGDGRGYVRARIGEDPAALAIDRAGGAVLLTEPNQVSRFTPAGHISQRFAAGRPVLLREAPAHFRDVAIQPDGKIIVAGTTSWLDSRGQMLVARLLRNGRLDPSFGHRGYATVGCKRRSRCKAVRVLVRGDGRILLAGSATHQGGIGRYHEEPSRIAVAQLLPDGRPDPSFGNGGFLTLKLGNFSLTASLALTRGRVLVGALTQTKAGIRGVVARLWPDGRLDRGYADHGLLRAFPKSAGVPAHLFPVKRRLIVVTKAPTISGHPSPSVLAFSAGGRPELSYRRLPTATLMPRMVSGPGAALQGGRLILAWTQSNKPKGGGEGTINLRLTRLSG